jgi:hypothetical protein
MKYINDFKKLIKDNDFNSFINKIFIYPLLYFIQYDYEKYKILALFATVFILVKDLINIKLLGLIDLYNFNNFKFPTILIYKFSKMLISIIFFFLQYKFKSFIKYNVWIANIFYLKYFIKLLIPNDFSNNVILLKIYKKYKKYASNLTNMTI